jgi:glycosyltransferase involved in cell wall biosynthesis
MGRFLVIKNPGIGDMKVMLGTVEVAGFVAGLTSGLRSIGVSAESYLSASHPFGYDGADDKQPLVVRIWRYLGSFRAKHASMPLPLKGMVWGLQFLLSWLVLFYSAFIFDAYIFVYGKTITNTRFELFLLRLMNKKIIFVYLGSDCRPPYLSGGSISGVPSDQAAARAVRASEKVSKKIWFQERKADYVVNAPGTGQFHRRDFVNWFSMGVPVSRANHTSATDVAQTARAVRILHSPSKPLIKGSDEIRAVVSRLQNKGYLIDFIELKGVPNSKVREELARCDFVIDQLYSDSPMAFFATEAAHFGKPTVVAGYFSECASDYIASDDMPPSVYVMPDKLEEAVANLIDDHKYRTELGLAARDFIHSRWDNRLVAQRYLQLLNGDVPASWLCSAKELSYIHGCGVDQDQIVLVGRYIVDHFGWPAFRLEGKSELKKQLAKLLNQPASPDA